MGIEEYIEVVRHLIDEVWNKGNFNVIDERITDDFVAYISSGAVLDRQQYRQSITNVTTNVFPDIQSTIEDVISEGDRVVVRETISGTQKGKYRNITPTGKAIKVNRVTIFRVQGEKITELWYLSDMLTFDQQLGVLTPTEEIGK